MNITEDQRGKVILLRRMTFVKAVTEVLCRRNHQHELIKRLPHNECDGIGTVCGMCGVTAQMIFDAVEKEGSKR